MTNEQLFTDREWGEAKMFGQYEQRENREEVVVFRRVDLAAYVTMIRAYDATMAANIPQYIDEMMKAEPVARVAGYYGGRCVVEPINPATILPVGAALCYTK